MFFSRNLHGDDAQQLQRWTDRGQCRGNCAWTSADDLILMDVKSGLSRAVPSTAVTPVQELSPPQQVDLMMLKSQLQQTNRLKTSIQNAINQGPLQWQEGGAYQESVALHEQGRDVQKSSQMH